MADGTRSVPATLMYAPAEPIPARRAEPLLQLAGFLSAASWAMVLVISSALFARGLIQPGGRPLDPVAAVLLVAALASLALLTRTYWQINSTATTNSFRWLILLLPGAALIASALAVTLPGIAVFAAALVWTAVLLEEAFALWQARRSWKLATQVSNAARGVRRPASDTASSESPSGATQSIVRVENADGTETISGTLSARFEAGQRSAAIHVGFCPPLSLDPIVECEQSGGPDADIKPVHILPHGAKFDIRLKRTALEPAIVQLEFHACSELIATEVDAGGV